MTLGALAVAEPSSLTFTTNPAVWSTILASSMPMPVRSGTSTMVVSVLADGVAATENVALADCDALPAEATARCAPRA